MNIRNRVFLFLWLAVALSVLEGWAISYHLWLGSFHRPWLVVLVSTVILLHLAFVPRRNKA